MKRIHQWKVSILFTRAEIFTLVKSLLILWVSPSSQLQLSDLPWTHSSHPCTHETNTCHYTTHEFISTHISGEWHLAALQSKEWDWETKGKVTPACVITLGSVFVCSICPSKALGSTLVKKPNKMAIQNLCQLLKRLRGQTYQSLYR